jgi:hypothetical protein
VRAFFAARPTTFKVAVPAGNALDQRVFGQASDSPAARVAPDAAALDQLERHADATFGSMYAHGITDEISASALTSFNLGLAELHRSIATRRAALATG